MTAPKLPVLSCIATAMTFAALASGCPAPTTVEDPLPTSPGLAPNAESGSAAQPSEGSVDSAELSGSGAAAAPASTEAEVLAAMPPSSETDPLVLALAGCGPEARTCAAGEYCHVPDGQCDELQAGECEPLATICTREFRPVCGCDGRTYANACGAAVEGVSVASQGECPPTR